MGEHGKKDPLDPVADLLLKDEVLQLAYWMAGEGFASEFNETDLRKFLDCETSTLGECLEQMVAAGLLETVNTRYRLTAAGRNEGGRRFADEFEAMLKPGHFECDEPDCDCHSSEFVGGPCRNLFPQLNS